MVIWTCSCGDSSAGTDSSESGETGGSTEATAGTTAGGGELCTPESTAVAGALDGADVNSSGATSARFLDQISEPSSLIVSWDGGSATFQWEGLASSATPIDVTGLIELDGARYCFGAGTLIIEDAGYDRFSVNDLTEAPSNNPADCPGATPVDGALEGCSDAG